MPSKARDASVITDTLIDRILREQRTQPNLPLMAFSSRPFRVAQVIITLTQG
jgi:hypothetical protein